MATDKEISRQLAGFVASALTERTGEKWEAREIHPDQWGSNLVNVESGAIVFVRLADRDKDRVEFIGSYPDGARTVHPEPKRIKATANRFRHPGELATVVLKRILPEYLPELERVKARKTEESDARRARVALAGRLLEASPGGRVEKPYGDDSRTGISWWNNDSWKADASINFRADGVSLELKYLTPDQAERVLRALND